MLILGPLGFAAPWVLGALVALPVLWLILRAMPPAPRLVAFPGVALVWLLGACLTAALDILCVYCLYLASPRGSRTLCDYFFHGHACRYLSMSKRWAKWLKVHTLS